MEKQDLILTIQAFIDQGKSKEEIYKVLLDQGFKVDEIEKAFEKIKIQGEKEDIQKKVLRILVIIGAIFIGVGVFSFVAANWQAISKPFKVLIIVSAMIVSYILGWILREKKGYKKTGEALILLGSIIYGAGIFLIAQMFHISTNWPDGFVLWMAGTLVVALGSESFSLFFLAILAGLPSIIGYFVIFAGYTPFLLTSSFMAFISGILSLVSGWLVQKQISKNLKEFY
ncbi:DUF2157 domain-containing protein [Candidatus Parcubacteria bacterium]|nr:DUF2157 domain-containing protein [Candidatus Parcubacteria bacterium]